MRSRRQSIRPRTAFALALLAATALPILFMLSPATDVYAADDLAAT